MMMVCRVRQDEVCYADRYILHIGGEMSNHTQIAIDCLRQLEERDEKIVRLKNLLLEVRAIGWLQAPHPITELICRELEDQRPESG